MCRSLWKVNFIKKNDNKNIIWKRGLVIKNKNINKIYQIHIGNGLITVLINELMLNHKFGEFGLTRKFSVKNRKRIKKLVK